jgi:hypothetical protein
MAQYQQYVDAGSRSRSQSPLKPFSSSRPTTGMGMHGGLNLGPYHGMKTGSLQERQQNVIMSAEKSFDPYMHSSTPAPQIGNMAYPQTYNQGAGVSAGVGVQAQVRLIFSFCVEVYGFVHD